MRLLLLDGSNLFWRSYHALRGVLDEGEHVAGIFGGINSLVSAVKAVHPTHLLWAMDDGRSNYRMSIYPQYKSHRTQFSLGQDAWNQATRQKRRLVRLLDLMGAFVWSEQGVEADDIIANCVFRWGLDAEKVVIVSADKDFRQLVTKKIVVLAPISGSEWKEWDEETVMEEYGVEPVHLPDLWALQGDTSDGIPGVPGVGPKTALKLLKTHGSLNATVMNDEKVAQHELEVFKWVRLIRLTGTQAQCDFEKDALIWNPVEPSQIQGQEIALELDRLGLLSLRKRWGTGTLWEESVVESPGKRLSERLSESKGRVEW